MTGTLPVSAAPQPIGRHVIATLRLAGPVMLARLALVFMVTVDVIVLGRAGAEELSAYVLGAALYDSLIATLAGLLMGVPVLVARETGAGRPEAAGAIWRRGLAYALLVGLALAGLLQGAGPLLVLTGQDPEQAAASGRVAAVLGFALPAMAAYIVSTSLLEALHRPLIGTIAVGLANLSNLGLNIVLVFGLGPVPALGAIGCAIATVVNATLLAAGLAAYVRFALPDRARYGIGRRRATAAPAPIEQRRIGYAAGASYGLEAAAFAVMTLFVGLIGTEALAAHGVLFQFLVLTFMLAFGIATATQVRVGNAWGRGDRVGMARAGWVGLGLALVITGAAALAYAVAPLTFLALFTTDPAVVAAAAPVMIWVVLAVMSDGGQTVMNSACRGRGDSWVPTGLQCATYWAVMVPAAWMLAFPLGQGLAGLYQAIALASLIGVSILSLRFRWLARRPAAAPRRR